jgi:hypothetical protein
MSGRTKLYQQAGSPLIQGDSKIVRPFWRVWLGAVAIGFLITWMVSVLVQWFVLEGGDALSFADAALGALFWAGVIGLPGLLIGAAIGAWLAKNMGWHRTSVSAGIVAAVFAFVSVFVVVFALGSSLTAPV